MSERYGCLRKLEFLRKEMERYQCDILSEMRWTALNGSEIIWLRNDTRHDADFVFLLSKRARAALLCYNPVSARLTTARFEAKPLNSSVGEIELFYKDLSMIVEKTPRRDVIIIGDDWNAKVENNNGGWERQTNNRKWTRRSSDGTTRNIIDMILMQRRWSTLVRQCQTFQGADTDSDRSLVITSIKIKLKRKVNANFQKKNDISKLNDEKIASIHRNTLEKEIKSLDRMEQLDTRVEEMTKTKQKLTLPEDENVDKKRITQEILKLVQEKRALRRDISEELEKHYKVKCDEAKKAVRMDKTKWLEDQCRNIEKYYGECETRKVCKMIRNVNKKWKPKQMAIKDKKGEVLVDRVKVLQMWTSYCYELYKETLDTDVLDNPVDELRKISPPSVENDITREEVERAVKRLKDNKSPGHGKIIGETIKHGGESLIDEIHQVCNEVWKQGKILSISIGDNT
ncbi:uncharacterized protein LOC111621111 [Centruroides sculpturatus]|uniref:uncharacterized protein LOC111621111 n=1 Tax=Centruroides sculpturatus TaxID=218467 RepID=UPI000C6D40A9|nr:uncharacterized protein LOC111621111 [Centruroides sculpturatus]